MIKGAVVDELHPKKVGCLVIFRERKRSSEAGIGGKEYEAGKRAAL